MSHFRDPRKEIVVNDYQEIRPLERGNIGFEELVIKEDYMNIYCRFNMRYTLVIVGYY